MKVNPYFKSIDKNIDETINTTQNKKMPGAKTYLNFYQ